MKDNIALKVRIYPTRKQKEKINKNFGCVRFVYNGLLSIYKERGKVVSYKELYNEDNLWLQESDTSSYSNVQINLKRAINNYYKNPNKFRLPIELSERIYTCSCGNIMDRDCNAALNIGEEGIKILFQEETMFAI